MTRSATLCNFKGIPVPLDWNKIRTEREHLNNNLMRYLKEDACVDGAPKDARKTGTYLDELSRGYVSILVEELVNLEKTAGGIGSTISFAVIYAELWRQATVGGTHHDNSGDSKVRWIENESSDPSPGIEIGQLQQLNERWGGWKGSQLENDYFLSVARNLASCYLKALEEGRVAAKDGDATSIKHHMVVLGDIFQEMLSLHETLMPTKNSRFSNNDGNTADSSLFPLQIPVARNRKVQISIPSDFDKSDWELLQSISVAYIERWKGLDATAMWKEVGNG